MCPINSQIDVIFWFIWRNNLASPCITFHIYFMEFETKQLQPQWANTKTGVAANCSSSFTVGGFCPRGAPYARNHFMDIHVCFERQHQTTHICGHSFLGISAVYIYIYIIYIYKQINMGGSLNGGAQQPWVFLLKMIILFFLGYHHLRKHPYISV